MAMAEEVVQEYKTSLLDLAVNSKPLINMLTIVAEENEQHAPLIVKAIEDHIYKCKATKKLPVLYLLDSIMKNLQKSSYKSLFSKNIVDVFSSVFEQVDEKTRASMYKLRQTWSTIVPNQKLYMIDKRINNLMDPAWPITATPPEQTSIHVNPKFLSRGDSDAASSPPTSPEVEEEEEEEENEETEALMRQQLIAKQQELLKLQQARLELELAEAQEKLSSKKKGKSHTTASKAAATSTGMLSLPLPMEMDIVPEPEPVIAPKEPIHPPAIVRTRDPRLQRMGPKQSKPPQVPTVSSGSGSFPGTIPPTHMGHVSSTQFTGPPATGPVIGSAGLMGPGMQQYGVMSSTGMMFPPQMGMQLPGQHPQEVFSGEVFTPEDNARFSDEKDSNDSDSSAQSVGTQQKSAINFRDPRFTRSSINQTEELRKKPAELIREPEHRNVHSHPEHRNVHSRPEHRNVHSHPQTSQSKTEHGSGGHERAQVRSMKEKGKGHSPRKSSAPVSSSSSHRSVSREKDDKSEARLKDFLESEKRRTENEKKKAEEEKRRSVASNKSNVRGRDGRSERDLKGGRRGEGDRNRGRSASGRDRERSPIQDKIPHQQPGRGDAADKGGRDPRKGRKSDEVTERETRATRRERADAGSSKKQEDRVKPATSDSRGRNKSSTSSRSKDPPAKTPPKKGAQKKEKRPSDTDDMHTPTKKVKLEPGSEPVSTDRRIKVEPEKAVEVAPVIKTEVEEKALPVKDDISDLFGAEDQDYRSVEQKTSPMTSPQSKGWDAFKASQPEQFKYDIELKKQRLEANRETDQDKMEPQDIDYRVQRQDSSASGHEEMQIPKELSVDHHGEILIQAHKKLQEGEITVEQHQQVVRQLQELMHIQKLQEENRRLSTEMAPGQPDLPAGAAMKAPIPVEIVIPPSREPVLPDEQRSPTRPMENYKIPRKPRDAPVEDLPAANRGRPQNQYPESAKQFDRPGQSRPVHDLRRPQESRGQIDPRKKLENWSEMDVERLPHRHTGEINAASDNSSPSYERRHAPVEFDRQGPSFRESTDIPAQSSEWQRDRPHDEFDERGLPQQDFGMEGHAPDGSEQRSRPQEFDQRGPSHHQLDRRRPHQQNLDRDGHHPQEFDRRNPIPRDLDRRGHPPEDFDRRDPASQEFDQRVTRSEDFDRRVPPLHGIPSEDFDRKGLPQEDFDRRGRPRGEFDRRGPAPHGHPQDFDRGLPHEDPVRRGPHRDLERRGHPDDFERRGPPPAEYDHRGQPPADFDRGLVPIDQERSGPNQANFDRRPDEHHSNRRQMPPEDFDRLGPPTQELESGPPEMDFHGRRRDPREKDFDGRGPPALDRANRGPPHSHPRLEASRGRNRQPRQSSLPERPHRPSLLGDGPGHLKEGRLEHGRTSGMEVDSRGPSEGLRDGPDEHEYFPGPTDGPPGRHPHDTGPQDYPEGHPEHRSCREKHGEFEDRRNRPGEEPMDWRGGPRRPALLEHPRPFGPRGPVNTNWRGQRPGGPGVVRPLMDLPMPSGSLPPSLREELERDRLNAIEQERNRASGQRHEIEQDFEHSERQENAPSTTDLEEKEMDGTENLSEKSSNVDSEEKEMKEFNEDLKFDPHGGLPPWKPVGRKGITRIVKKKSPEPGVDSKRTPSPNTENTQNPPSAKSGEETPKESGQTAGGGPEFDQNRGMHERHGPYSRTGDPQQFNEPQGQDSPRLDDLRNDIPRGVDPHRNDHRQGGPRRDDPRQGGPQRDDSKQGGPRRGNSRQRGRGRNSRQSGPQSDDPRQSGPQRDDPRQRAPQRDDPRREDPRQVGSEHGDSRPRHDDPRSDAPRQDNPFQGDPRPGRPQHAGPRPGGPQHDDIRQEATRQGSPFHGDPRQEGPRQDGSFHGDPRQGPRQDGPFHGDPRQDGPRQDGPFHGDPRQEGRRHDGPFQGDPRQSARHVGPRPGGPGVIRPLMDLPMPGGPRQEGPRQDGPFNGNPRHSGPHDGPRPGAPRIHDPRPGGPQQKGPRQEGPFPGGPMQQGGPRFPGDFQVRPFSDGPMNQGPSDQAHNRNQPRLLNQEQMNSGSIKQEPINQDAINQGPMNMMHQEQMNQGPMNQGPMNQGPMNRGPMNQSVPRHPIEGGPRGPQPGMLPQGPGPVGPRFDGPRGPPGSVQNLFPPGGFPRGPMDRFRGPVPQQEKQEQPMETYIDKFGDPRFRCFSDMGPEVSEEVVLGKRNYEIKVGAPPRRIMWGSASIEVFADPSKRGVVIDGVLLYKFGEKVKEVSIKNRREKIFYHGRPLSIWIDGQHYEARVDSPPKAFIVNGVPHKIQIDGRDMMILIDKEEKGKYGGEPRFVYIDDERKELRFDHPPRHIMIDGKMSELMLNMKQPCVNIEGKLHGIRFDGPPRDVFINGNLYQIFVDHAVKVRVGNRFHYIALGGPCHEMIVDGRWFEVKFNEAPKEVNLGNRVLEVRLPGGIPDVKILPEIMQQPMPMSIPQPGLGAVGMPIPPGQPVLSMPPPGMRPNVPVSMFQPAGLPPGPIPTMPGSMIMSQPLPALGPGVPMNPPTSMPNVLSSLPSTSTAPQAASSGLPFDINSLLTKLVSSGIIKNEPETKPAATAPTQPAAKPASKPADKPAKKAVDKKEVPKAPEFTNIARKGPKVEIFEDMADMTRFAVAEMKALQQGSIQRLYAGVQCTTCGVRFTLDDDDRTEKYRQHLDWHFRMNRRKDDQRVAKCRKWYYGLNDWLQYEEMGDTEDITRSNFFEQQQQQQQVPSSGPAPTPQVALITVPEGVSVTKCPAATGNDKDDMCDICHEMFEQYWDEELEEWHLRDAIKVNNKTYHPICYEDYSDITEGTPTPSDLTTKGPDFSTQKSINYEESTPDGQAQSSFVEVRGIADPTIPGLGLGTSTVRQSRYDTAVKTEPDRNILERVKDESGEPTDQVPMDTEMDVPKIEIVDSALIKKEPESTGSVVETPAPGVDSVNENLGDVQQFETVTVKEEPVEVVEQVRVSAVELVPVSAVKPVETVMESVEAIKPEPIEAVVPEPMEAVKHDFVGEIKREPLTEVVEQPVEAIKHEPLTAVVQEPVEAVIESVEAVEHKPVSAMKHEPLDAVEHEPVSTMKHDPLEAVEHEPIESVRHEPVESIRHEPVESIRHESVEAGKHEPVEVAVDQVPIEVVKHEHDEVAVDQVPVEAGKHEHDEVAVDQVPIEAVKHEHDEVAVLQVPVIAQETVNVQESAMEVIPVNVMEHENCERTEAVTTTDIYSGTPVPHAGAAGDSAQHNILPVQIDTNRTAYAESESRDSSATNQNMDISEVAPCRTDSGVTIPPATTSIPMETDLDIVVRTTDISPISSEASSRPVSSLDKVKVAVPQGVLEISEEVLEISSNASTPTYDELPSPSSLT